MSSDPNHSLTASVAADHCKLSVPVYEVSDPRLDLSTGQVHIHIDLSDHHDPSSEVLNLSCGQDIGTDSYYEMSSSVTMDETETSAGKIFYSRWNTSFINTLDLAINIQVCSLCSLLMLITSGSFKAVLKLQ